VRAIYRFFRSVRLAIVLILLLTVLALLSTFVPQGEPAGFYAARYPPFVAGLLAVTGMTRFFTSALFLAPVLLFTVNLGVCAVGRFVTRARTGATRRHGPDLLHAGLLLLLAGALVTSLGRQEKRFWMAKGEQAVLDSSWTLTLLDFEFQRYQSGAPKDWISTVRAARNGAVAVSSFPIEVNRPLRLAGMRIYQASWTLEGTVRLRDAAGESVTAMTGQGFQDGESFWYIAEVRHPLGFPDPDQPPGWNTVVEEWKGHELASTRTLAAGDSIGPFRIEGISGRLLTGLTSVRDPGFPLVLAAIILAACGLALTYLQKRGDKAS
jgi:cytochrome c biogenesis protein